MRVTVVATGLGLDEDQKTAELQTELRKRLAGNGVPDYGVLDKPTVIRNKKQRVRVKGMLSSRI